MKKIYSYVLMAAMLLIGTSAWATIRTASNATEFENAWKAAVNTDTIQLTSDVTISKILWLGTADMNGLSKSLTLDLNGHVLTQNEARAYMFVITHGELNVITSQAGGQVIQNGSNNEEMFRVTGSTYKNVNPKTAESGYYSHLTIGAGVTVDAKKNAIVTDVINNGNFWTGTYAKAAYVLATAGTTAPTAMPYSAQVYSGKGVANGVRIDVQGAIRGEKYAFKANGNLGSPTNAAAASLAGFWADPEQTIQYAKDEGDVDYSPFIHIYSTADVRVPASNTSSKKPVAVYCSGYARWLIEGTCIGSTAVYVKSGDVDINDATIQSNYTGDYTPASATNSGVTASGSAIVVESNAAYSGDIDVTVSGDSHVTATNGYAIDESVTSATDTKVDAITISGGEFVGGTVPDGEGGTMQGTISISDKTATEASSGGGSTAIVVAGGSIEGEVTFGNEGDLGDIIDNSSSYATTVTNPETGQQTVVIKPGSEPVVVVDNFNINNFAGGDVNLSSDVLENENQVFNSALEKMYINTLQINPPTHTVTLTIPTGKTIQAKTITLGGNGKIIVEPGAQLIVSGGDGITTAAAGNLILKANVTQQGKFLIDPAIESNRHPKATVEFVPTKSYYVDGANHQWERFAIPTWNTVTSVECATPGLVADIQAFQAKGWKSLGFITGGTPYAGASQMNQPFGAYNMLVNRAAASDADIYRFTGELTGSMDATLTLDHEFTPFANSYMADVDLWELLGRLEGDADVTPTVYVNTPSGPTFVWSAINEEWYDDEVLAPLQGFYLYNEVMEVRSSGIDYEDMVWNPAMGIAPAPARRAAIADDNTAKLRIAVTNEQGVKDDVKMTERATNLNNSPKCLNDDMNFYAHADENKLAIVAAENLDDTYFGFSTVNGGEFTISFQNVEGREFDLVDLEANMTTAVVEGNTYTFTAAPNTKADYRFKLVDRKKVITDVDKIDADKNVKGIYTIMGQYVGEMNIWNTLPAGVYVVDGAKRVK